MDERDTTARPDPTDSPQGAADERSGGERASSERELDTREDRLLRREERAAAAEAARIGGTGPDYDSDEESRPLAEGGGGVAEGFEEAERELVDEASHGDPGFNPQENAFTPELESDRASAVYGEPDEVDPTEVVSDPREDEDDPGRGPRLASSAFVPAFALGGQDPRCQLAQGLHQRVHVLLARAPVHYGRAERHLALEHG